MSYNTMIFSEKWFCVARELKGEAKLQYLEAVLNYGLRGARPTPYNLAKLNDEAQAAFENSEYEIELLNPKYTKLGEDFNYDPLDKGGYMTSKEIKEKFGISLNEKKEDFNPNDYEEI